MKTLTYVSTKDVNALTWPVVVNDITLYSPAVSVFTDFEKALKIIVEQGFETVDVFAANGLEQDHFLGNLTTALKSNESEKIELDITETLNGQALPVLTRKKVNFPGKDLFLISELEIDEDNDTLNVDLQTRVGLVAIALPFKVKYQDDNYVVGVTNYTIPTSGGSIEDGTTGSFFYLLNDRDKIIKLDIDIDIDYNTPTPGAGATLNLLRYTGDTYQYVDSLTLDANASSNSGNLTYTGI